MLRKNHKITDKKDSRHHKLQILNSDQLRADLAFTQTWFKKKRKKEKRVEKFIEQRIDLLLLVLS